MPFAIAKVITFPKYEALKYERYILKTLRGTLSLLNTELKTFFANNSVKKLDSSIRTDDYIDDLQTLLADITSFIASNDNKLIRDLLLYGGSLLRYSQKQLYNSFKDILRVEVANPSLGIDVFSAPLLEPQINLMLKSWVSTNVSLIKSIQTDLLDDVGVIIESSFRAGQSMPTLAKQLQSKFNISRNKAKFIGRDQTSKLHSDYILHEYELLGISEYVWSTSGDERVRDSHKVLDGKICQCNDATTYRDSEKGKIKSKVSIGGALYQFGKDYGCRCCPRAIVNTTILLSRFRQLML